MSGLCLDRGPDRVPVAEGKWICNRQRGHPGLHGRFRGTTPMARWSERGELETDPERLRRWADEEVAFPRVAPRAATATFVEACAAVSAQGTVCSRAAGHEGCHEALVDGDSRRWWDEPEPEPVSELTRLIADAAREGAS